MSKSQSFQGFLTLQEINTIVVEAVSKCELRIVAEQAGELVPFSDLYCLPERPMYPLINRAFIVCNGISLATLESTDPPPFMVLHVPKPKASHLGEAWIAYKIHDQYLDSDCAASIISCFRKMKPLLKKRLIGHILAYFPNDREHFAIYKDTKYSEGALALYRSGIGWRDNGTICEPVVDG
jgi:hypothetical protein